MNQKERILGFLQEIFENETNPEEQAVILRAQDFVSNGIINGTCINEIEDSCGRPGVTNEECTNKNGVCGLSSNTKTCYNQPNLNKETDKCSGSGGTVTNQLCQG